MKRSQTVKILVESMGCYDSWEQQCDYMLKQLEDAGMLPPIQNPSLIEDTYHGGQKHGPTLRVWDEENS